MKRLLRLFLRPKPRRRVVLRPEGAVYNLTEIFADLNERYFEGSLNLGITWFGNGRMPKTRVRWGSYHMGRQEIRVNRLLDGERIPKHVVEFIVYHEMLHHVLPPKMGKNGRREIHHREFKAREKVFEHFAQANNDLKWLAKDLSHSLQNYSG